ncbi:YdhK family protein [Paenisporosarcina sp. NPDC076898]|uniref:YdhK family protein n=1 Tax=unclassified Paenisporosarcina TaxID=2642018 RepID=UPI003D07EE1C
MKKKLLYLSAAAMVVLSGCGNDTSSDKEANHEEMDHGDSHSSSGEVPEGLKEATNPTFEVGSKATITNAHMKGMKDAEATIVGAYDTTVYTISYTPTTGGEKVKDHKWIIHEEIKDATADPYKAGDEVIVEADHMEGMKGATAKVDSAEQTTVYMVDYISTDSGEEVKNHMWVTESELTAE